MFRSFVLLSTQSGSRTRKHLFLKQVALPVCVPERVFVAFGSAKERYFRGAKGDFVFPIAFNLLKSVQWDSNPHIRLGRAAGCRYIMDAVESRIGFAAAADHRADRLEAYPTYLFSQSAWRELNPLPVAYKTTALTA